MATKKKVAPVFVPELRLYTFVNFYLSSIQQGIQTAHVVSELFSYNNLQNDTFMINEWANRHKTIIVCNGGMGSDIVAGHALIASLGAEYPYASFREEPNAMGSTPGAEGVMTAFGIILPNTVYEAKPVYVRVGSGRRTGAWEYGVRGVNYVKWHANSPEAQICEYVSTKHLAR